MNKIEPFKMNVLLTSSAKKQLSLIAKINCPFSAVQVVFKKGLDVKVGADFSNHRFDTGSELVFITREYDGSERYLLLYPNGVSLDSFPQDKNIIFLS